MKKLVILISFSLFFNCARTQSVYCGYNFDFNSSLGTLHTYAAALHAEARLGKHSNWYCNWDFAMGAESSSDFYGRANITILAYGDPNYWRNLGSSTNSGGELIAVVVAPLLCPVGLSNYFFTSRNRDLRLGFYINPLMLDYWDLKDPIKSWSVHGGLKLLYKWHHESNLYIKIGGISLRNTYHYQNSNRYDGVLFNFSVGTLFGLDND